MTDEMKTDKTEYIEKINNLLDLSEIADLLKSNEKQFEVNGITYRIKKPNFKQRQEVYQKKIEKYVEMLKDEKYLLEQDLKKLYLKRGIDLDSLDIELQNKIRRRDDVMLKLGEAIKKEAPEPDLMALESQIKVLNSEAQELSLKKNMYLEFSLEQQINIFVYTYYAYLLAEQLVPGKDLGEGNKEPDKWIKVWNTYAEFEEGEQKLLNRFNYYATLISHQDNVF